MALVLALLLASVPPASEPQAQPSTVEAGFGKGVTVRTTDGTFSVNARGRIQFQGAPSVPEPGGDPQTHDVGERVAALRPIPPRRLQGRLEEAFPVPVVELASRQAGQAGGLTCRESGRNYLVEFQV
jgi:hypothetical protein